EVLPHPFVRLVSRCALRGSPWIPPEEVLALTLPLIIRRYVPFSGPLQTLEDRASHHPVLVALREEAQFLREMGDALAVGGFGKRVRQVGPPVAALRAVGVEHAA